SATSNSASAAIVNPNPNPNPHPMRPPGCVLAHSCSVHSAALAKCIKLATGEGITTGIGAAAVGGDLAGGIIIFTITYAGSLYWCYYLG
ncbi:MAG: hypothetical protein ABI400_10970, partial [Lacisediminihabitans sp.]